MDRTPASQAGNAGSIPAGVTIHGGCSQAVRQRIVVPPIAGSIPVIHPIWVSRLAAMAADCKSAGFTIVGSSPTWPTKQKRAASVRKSPNIISIAQRVPQCLFSFYQKSIVFSYGTSHLENFSNRMYYEDTKKE